MVGCGGAGCVCGVAGTGGLRGGVVHEERVRLCSEAPDCRRGLPAASTPGAYARRGRRPRPPHILPLLSHPHPTHTTTLVPSPSPTTAPPQHYRKNQYEEALFRAEDDHFELDMIIDQNASAMRALRPLAAALEAMGEEERGGWQLPERALRAFHFRAVQRIYGEQGAQVGGWVGRCGGGVGWGWRVGAGGLGAQGWACVWGSAAGRAALQWWQQRQVKTGGAEILRAAADLAWRHRLPPAQVVALLRQNPAVAVPTVLNRLSQKDSEWRQVGAELALSWR